MRTCFLAAVLLMVSAPAVAQIGQQPSEDEIGSVQIYLDTDQAIREVFDDVMRVESVVALLTPEDLEAIKEAVGVPASSDTVTVYLVYGEADGLLGWAMVDEEVGKYRPITFLVGVRPDGEVQGVEVLVYRESRGGEVRRSRFLRQYRGKEADDPIRLNRDILNVAGATMSVNALNHGVKRVLVILDLLAQRDAQ